MTRDAALDAIREVIQEDVGNRGLRKDPASNLISATPADFLGACHSIAEHPQPALAIVTGFYIPTAQPPAGETDGPLGALFLARALAPLGLKIAIASDGFCIPALQAGLAACGLATTVPLVKLNRPSQSLTPADYWSQFQQAARLGQITHLLAIERVGPSHTVESIQRQGHGALGETLLDFLHTAPTEHQDRCHTMRGRDITDQMSPAH